MLIKEGSLINIIQSGTETIATVTAHEDMEINGIGNGYTILFSGGDGSIFESDIIIEKSKNEYVIVGYWKDALQVKDNTLFKSYTD